jgi:hypothetical protein
MRRITGPYITSPCSRSVEGRRPATTRAAGGVEQLDGLRRDLSVDEDVIALGAHTGHGAEVTTTAGDGVTEQPEQAAHDGAEDRPVQSQQQAGDHGVDPVEQAEQPAEQGAQDGALAGRLRGGAPDRQPAGDPLDTGQPAADYGGALHGEPMVGEIVHRPFRSGIGGVGGNDDLPVRRTGRRR